ncbi:MAG: hypothetical protein NZM06_06960 [Chloroherpetonaceae bacterium]|nr:hypothetical protein [Chloroherpetonaceae bacterium]MDW8437778.1 hypothetical protein [Chloroherpetonaceae bacterium]
MTETTETLKPTTQESQPPTELVVNGVDDGQEEKDARVILVSFVIGAIAITGLLFFLTDYFTIRKEEQAQAANAVVAPTYRDIRAREEERLNSYKIINEKEGVYQIPIGEAMKLLVNEAYERKLKAAEPPPPEANAKNARATKDQKDQKKVAKGKGKEK